MRGIRSSSKRKWIVGGAVLFGAVALLTTGFATWIIGAQNLKSQNNIDVSVDTAENNFIEFSYNLVDGDHEIVLAEDSTKKSEYDGLEEDERGIVGLTGTDFVEKPLTVSGVMTLMVGRTYLESHTFKSVEFTIVQGEGDTSVSVLSANNLLQDESIVGSKIRPDGSYSYLRAPEVLEFGENAISKNTTNDFWSVSNAGDVFTFKHTFEVSFRWGTFFGNTDDTNNSPYEYYNGLASSLSSDAEKRANTYGAITAELTAMKDQLNGKSIKLLAEIQE